MSNSKTVKDLMIGIFEYPHIPYWFSINQAMRIIKVTFLSTNKYPEPMVILVFDEKYNFIGTLTMKDILKGLEPKLKSSSATTLTDENAGLSMAWDTLFTWGSKELAEKPVSDIMVKSGYFIEPTDPVTKAAYLMLHHDLILLPVLEEKKKIIGLIRMTEVFDEISGTLLKE